MLKPACLILSSRDFSGSPDSSHGSYLPGVHRAPECAFEAAEAGVNFRNFGKEARGGLPPEDDAAWNKGHGRIERSQIARVGVSPEQIGLCGCRQVIAVRRQRIQLGPRAGKNSDEIGYYATSKFATLLSNPVLKNARKVMLEQFQRRPVLLLRLLQPQHHLKKPALGRCHEQI